MRALLPFMLTLTLSSVPAFAAVTAYGQKPDGLSAGAGLGLRAPEVTARDTDIVKLYGTPGLYRGVREMPRLGLQSKETYSGIFQPLSRNWGSSIESGYTTDPVDGLPRYSLAGQLRTALSPQHGFSLGLKFTSTDPAADPSRFSSGSELGGIHDVYLMDRLAGGSSYELRFNYLYGARYSLGLSYQLGTNGYFNRPYGLEPGTRMFAVTSEHWLTPNWALSYDISAPEAGGLLQSPNFGMGLRYRF